ncbi:hypothetical protein DV738_g4061, partial [Chaetothyriales sp. CBS 135597]
MAVSVLGKRSRRNTVEQDVEVASPSKKRHTRSSAPRIYEDQKSNTASIRTPVTRRNRTTKRIVQNDEPERQPEPVTKTLTESNTDKDDDAKENLPLPFSTPSTTRFKDVFAASPFSTPKHRVKVAGSLLTPRSNRTPTTPRCKSVYAAARQLFTQSANPSQLVGRDAERQQLRSFIDNALAAKRGGCTYVSGPPGTGKSALVEEIFQSAAATGEVKTSFVNCVAVRSANLVVDQLTQDLDLPPVKGKKSGIMHLQQCFGSRNKQGMYLVLLDEIDSLLDSDSEFLYGIFECAMRPTSSLILIGIANALDLTDRFLPRLKTRDLEPHLLPFLPYTATQMSDIIAMKLRSLLPAGTSADTDFVPFMQPAAIQLIGKKIASQTGDLRKAFSLARRTIDQIEQDTARRMAADTCTTPIKQPFAELVNLPSQLPPTPESSPTKTSVSPNASDESRGLLLTIETAPRATIGHVAKIASSIFSNGAQSRLAGLNLQQKAVLCSLVANEKKRSERDPFKTPSKSSSRILTVRDLFDKYGRLCQRDDGLLQPLKNTEFRDVIASLETLGLVHESAGRTSSLFSGSKTPSKSRNAEDRQLPVLRHASQQQVDRLGALAVEQTQKWEQKVLPERINTGGSHKKGPAGGYDATPVPSAPPGYTLRITFDGAENLPFADLPTLSSDPYVFAVLKTGLAKRHPEDADLSLRTPTIHRNKNPTWKTEWIVANVPASGFSLKCEVYDEDPSDHDDRLGKVRVEVPAISDDWQGFTKQKFQLQKRSASKRAYLFRALATLFCRNVEMSGYLIVSVENLGRTPGKDGGRAYTVGPLAWSRHYSPLIGRLTGTKGSESDKDGTTVEKYNFQAVQMQLTGPVPAQLYHRYVEFRPFVAGMFTDHSLRGRILNRALHHQHARIYNYDRSTNYGIFHEPCLERTNLFLEFVQYDHGGRIFTYVVTLDGNFRFTETGKEFGIDMLSKHTMHSDVSIYIAFSGEFFIRRIKHSKNGKSESSYPATQSSSPAPASQPTSEHPAAEDGDEDISNAIEPATRDSPQYELIIDNDSGTYRPNAKLLPVLRDYMASNFPGLKVITLDCQADEEKMQKLKSEQREFKKKSGAGITYLQNKSLSSISSSDISDLNERARDGQVHENKVKREIHKYIGHGNDEFHDDAYEPAQNGTTGASSGHEEKDAPVPLTNTDDGNTEHWFARRSQHANVSSKSTTNPGHASWDEFVYGLRDNHSEHERDFTPTLYDARKVVDWSGQVAKLEAEGSLARTGFSDVTAAIYEMCHDIPPPMKPRCFGVFVVTASVIPPSHSHGDEEKFIAVTVPVYLGYGTKKAFYANWRNLSEGENEKQRRDTVQGVYCAVETCTLRRRKGSSNKEDQEEDEIDWLMATASDAKGALPMWMQKLALPGTLPKDVGYFIKWIQGVDDGVIDGCLSPA